MQTEPNFRSLHEKWHRIRFEHSLSGAEKNCRSLSSVCKLKRSGSRNDVERIAFGRWKNAAVARYNAAGGCGTRAWIKRPRLFNITLFGRINNKKGMWAKIPALSMTNARLVSKWLHGILCVLSGPPWAKPICSQHAHTPRALERQRKHSHTHRRK